MKRVIDISEDAYELLLEKGTCGKFANLGEIVANSTPLEQEPTTKNNLGVDCISRAEAIKCLECDFDITGKENMKTVVNYINSAHDKIVNLPRVKQEPETGHWINRGKQGEVLPFYMRYECSMCGETADKSNYCPNCGAKMAETEGT